jgi:hypothetical protein
MGKLGSARCSSYVLKTRVEDCRTYTENHGVFPTLPIVDLGKSGGFDYGW